MFLAYFKKSPLKKNKALFAFHIVNAVSAVAICAIAMMGLDFSTLFFNWIPAAVILLLWIIEFFMRRNLMKHKVTA